MAAGFRRLLGIHIGPTESEASWSELLEQLVARGLAGVRPVISDENACLKAAVRHWLPETDHQRCTVHLQRNVTTKVPRRLQNRVIKEVSEIFKATSADSSRETPEEFEARWSKQIPEAVACLNNGFFDATRFFSYPAAHWRRVHTTNSLERLHGEIKRRTKAVGALPDRDSAMRLIAGVAIKTCARWGDCRYLEMELLNEKEIEEAA